MQQKVLKYGLLTGVALIWSMIIYRIIAAQNEPNSVVPAWHALAKQEPIIIDSFSLNIDYPDPFLPDTTFQARGSETQIIEKVIAPTVVEVPKPDLSYIQYHGMMSNRVKKTRVAIVQIHGKDLLVKEREEIGSISVKKILPEKLIVSINGTDYQIRVE